jgi:sugar O-acyltransferase (sialic acid O-acetyltransferase NeuD family)
MSKIVIFGLGAYAEEMHYNLTRHTPHEVAAFTVDRAYLTTPELLGCPVVPFDEAATRYPPGEYEMVVAVGYVRVNRLRAERVEQAQALGYSLISYIDPTARLWDGLAHGTHCKIGAQTLVQPFARIGHNVFIGSGCIIGHHAVIRDHCFIASGVVLGGSVEVEPYAFIGTGATVRNQLRVARDSVIGAGAVILRDTQPGGVYLASPATKLDITSDALPNI